MPIGSLRAGGGHHATARTRARARPLPIPLSDPRTSLSRMTTPTPAPPVAEPAFQVATRAFYDTVVDDYIAAFGDIRTDGPVGLAMLGLFADLVTADGGGPVLEVGSGPGRICGHLAGLGLSVAGVDLSPGMVAAARRDHPDLRFEVGSMARLEQADASLAGLVAWYSVIHIPDPELPGVIAEFDRVLAPGGVALLAFQVGEEVTHYTEAWGHEVSVDFHRRTPERMTDLLHAVGWQVRVRTVREPEGSERLPQGYLVARKPPLPAAG